MSTRLGRYRAIAVTVLIAVLLGTGCSAAPSPQVRANSGAVSSPTIGPATQQQLRADLEVVANAAAQGRLADAQAALTTLKIDLAAANAAGSISSTRFSEIRDAAAALDAELAQLMAPPATTVAAPSPGQQTTTGGGNKGGDNKDKDKGGGNGGTGNQGNGGD